jgi:DnaK suppressor protein
MAVGWAKEGDGELEAENEIAAEIQRAREALEESQGAPRTDCVDCGEPIGKARLKAMPHAQRCITCQSEYE